MCQSLIKVRDLNFKYDDNTVTLRNINLDFKDKRVYVLLGKNGSGKTTLMNILMYLTRFSEGEIYYNGKKLTSKIAKTTFGYMETPGFFYEYMTVKQFLEYICLNRSISKKEYESLISLWLKKTNLVSKKEVLIGTLSQGMRQRLNFVVSVLHKPHFLLLDEPFNGLDFDETANLQNIIHEYAKENTVLISTHVFSQITTIATNVIFMKDGEITEEKDFHKNKWRLQDYEQHYKELNE